MDERTNQMSAVDSHDLRTSTDDMDENTEQLRSNIEDTRAEMTQTINEIQERLSPEHLMGQVKETVREATIGKVERVMEQVGETLSEVTEPALEMAGRAGTAIKDAGSSVGATVWRNPIPFALIGLGVGMIVMRKSRGRSYDVGSSSRRSLSQGSSSQQRRTNYEMGLIGERTQMQTSRTSTSGASTLGQMKETASDLASRSTEALSNLGTKAKDSASAVSTRFERMMRENPLAVGAVAVAAGTAVGLMLPSTQIESDYIGAAGERIVDKVEDVARGALDKVKDAAHDMAPQQG